MNKRLKPHLTPFKLKKIRKLNKPDLLPQQPKLKLKEKKQPLKLPQLIWKRSKMQKTLKPWNSREKNMIKQWHYKRPRMTCSTHRKQSKSPLLKQQLPQHKKQKLPLKPLLRQLIKRKPKSLHRKSKLKKILKMLRQTWKWLRSQPSLQHRLRTLLKSIVTCGKTKWRKARKQLLKPLQKPNKKPQNILPTWRPNSKPTTRSTLHQSQNHRKTSLPNKLLWELPIWLRRKLERSLRANRLLNIRNWWLRDELILNINSNLFGLLARLGALCSILRLIKKKQVKKYFLTFSQRL